MAGAEQLTEAHVRQIVREEIARAIAPARERKSSAPHCQSCVDGDRVVKGTNFKCTTEREGKTYKRVCCRDCGKSWYIEA